MDVKNKKITVVGLGNSGINAALLLRQHGANVYATDAGAAKDLKYALELLKAKSINVECGGHTKSFIQGSELVVLSPGVENSSPAVKWADEMKIPIIGEMELGYRFCKGKIIAITGTNGKSTVTTLIGEILKNGGKDTVVCGNIGNSLCGEIPKISEDTWVVLEVSSFQLERIDKFKPSIALILNITDDHMDRYDKFSDYYSEKMKVFSNQEKCDFLILNYDAENLREVKDRARSKVLFYSKYDRSVDAYSEEGKIFCKHNNKVRKIGSVSNMILKGLHNLENVIACSLVGVISGVSEPSIRNAVLGFKGLAHRFETVDTIDGVEYIDDSKGTTVDSTIRALESCNRPVVLIAGGKDKNSDYSVIKDLVARKVKHLIVIGEAKDRIKEAMAGAVDVRDATTMDEAVKMAHDIADKGMAVLLSPMCSSFDMFRSYKERGEVFKKAVGSLR